MRIYRLVGLMLIISSSLISCEKSDIAIQLPSKGDAELTSVEMGENYEDQIFFDFQTGRVVHTSEINSWDLAFEASPNGRVVFLNGGTDSYIYNTRQKNILDVNSLPSNITKKDWLYDASCGINDSAVLNNWDNGNGISKQDVYILKLNPTLYPDTFKKIQLISVSPTEYVFQYGDLRGTNVQKMIVPKDDNYNYSYFSFSKGGELINPEPPKDSWDIVFTRYRYVYHHLDDFPYIVSGVLTNPYKTSTTVDSTSGFSKVNINSVINHNFSNYRDIIGFDWKSYSIDKGLYTVDATKTFVIKNRNEQYWKIHFLDFYSKTGVKGSPSFEFQRIQ